MLDAETGRHLSIKVDRSRRRAACAERRATSKPIITRSAAISIAICGLTATQLVRIQLFGSDHSTIVSDLAPGHPPTDADACAGMSAPYSAQAASTGEEFLLAAHVCICRTRRARFLLRFATFLPVHRRISRRNFVVAHRGAIGKASRRRSGRSPVVFRSVSFFISGQRKARRLPTLAPIGLLEAGLKKFSQQFEEAGRPSQLQAFERDFRPALSRAALCWCGALDAEVARGAGNMQSAWEEVA